MKLLNRFRLAFLVLFTNRTVVNVRDKKTGRFVNANYKPRIKKAFDRLLKFSKIEIIPSNFTLNDITNILELNKKKKGITLFVQDDTFRTINRYFILSGIGNLTHLCEIPNNNISTLGMNLTYGYGEVTFTLLGLLDHKKLDKKHLIKKGQCLLVEGNNEREFFSELFKLQKLLK
jgi:hypothetical protein